MLGSHTPSPQSPKMWANWNHLLCSPAAIPPRAVISLTLINYKSGCGWINTPKGNLCCELSCLWGGMCGFSRWHSYLGVSTQATLCTKPWTKLHGQGSTNPDSVFPQNFHKGCTLLRALILIYSLLHSHRQWLDLFSAQKLWWDRFFCENVTTLFFTDSWMIPLQAHTRAFFVNTEKQVCSTPRSCFSFMHTFCRPSPLF